MSIRRALISVSNKSGVVEFAQGLAGLGAEILSTGGTAAVLREAGLAVSEIADYTGVPEMFDGRVKTLHPKVHGAILARRDVDADVVAMKAHGILPIDLVAVNLYPFREAVARPSCTLNEAMESIDIGGAALLRAAAKNYAHVAVVTDPADYLTVVAQLRAHGGALPESMRYTLAAKAFAHTAEYDAAVSNYLTSTTLTGARRLFPERLTLTFSKAQDLRYGENPHQQAALYRDVTPVPGTICGYSQLQGKDLSYNNIADADAAWECVRGFTRAACVIVKHANPCGAALADSPLAAYRLAFATDPTSAFGGIIAFNCRLDDAAARAVADQFVEVIIAPEYTQDALGILAAKGSIRVLAVPLEAGANAWDFKRVGGGLVAQTADRIAVQESALRCVTRALPTPAQIADLLFAFRIAAFVKSNAIVFAQRGQTLGIGAGQMSRVDSTRIAAMKARDAGVSLVGSVAASDAFFPFRDGLDVVAEAGAKAVIQPGGSIRDNQVIQAADEHGIAMVFTGERHFRH
jgi:phosphoribosylaminoimidazolecarboxamide formyltransferase / IMP cyclohydrolase